MVHNVAIYPVKLYLYLKHLPFYGKKPSTFNPAQQQYKDNFKILCRQVKYLVFESKVRNISKISQNFEHTNNFKKQLKFQIPRHQLHLDLRIECQLGMRKQCKIKIVQCF